MGVEIYKRNGEPNKRAKIKCQFCNWETYVWAGRRGKRPLGPYDAWDRLSAHMYEEHQDELREIERRCGEIEEDSIRYVDMV